MSKVSMFLLAVYLIPLVFISLIAGIAWYSGAAKEVRPSAVFVMGSIVFWPVSFVAVIFYIVHERNTPQRVAIVSLPNDTEGRLVVYNQLTKQFAPLSVNGGVTISDTDQIVVLAVRPKGCSITYRRIYATNFSLYTERGQGILEMPHEVFTREQVGKLFHGDHIALGYTLNQLSFAD